MYGCMCVYCCMCDVLQQQGETHRFEKLVRVFRETGMESPEFAVSDILAPFLQTQNELHTHYSTPHS